MQDDRVDNNRFNRFMQVVRAWVIERSVVTACVTSTCFETIVPSCWRRVTVVRLVDAAVVHAVAVAEIRGIFDRPFVNLDDDGRLIILLVVCIEQYLKRFPMVFLSQSALAHAFIIVQGKQKKNIMNVVICFIR